METRGVPAVGWLVVCGLSGAVSPGWAQDDGADAAYFQELPVVLSATRLSQNLADVPGAMTVIDREMITASGAREIADLLRLVPGFQVSMNQGTPIATYHGFTGYVSRHMQVLVDGRSVYSSSYLGGVDWNALGVLMDDVERVEVFRGSNSAAHGANAALGVVNIVTRHPSQSRGGRVSLSRGGDGVRDVSARYGWGGEGLDARLSAGYRSDTGIQAYHDTKQVRFINFRADKQVTSRDELQVLLGATHNSFEAGLTGYKDGDFQPDHAKRFRSHFEQLRWRRVLSPEEEFSFTFHHQFESNNQNFSVPLPRPFNAIFIDYGGATDREHLQFEHTLGLWSGARLAWGAEARRDAVSSVYQYTSDRKVVSMMKRLFGNLEWRPAEQWLINAGAMLESNSIGGTHSAPRLFLNYQPSPEHTFRIGTSKAFRIPTAYEQTGLTQYRWRTIVLDQRFGGQGSLSPEMVRAREVGYLGDLRRFNLTVDVRVFREHLDGLLGQLVVQLPKGSESQLLDETARDKYYSYINQGRSSLRGQELTLRWKPQPQTLVWLGAARLRAESDDTDLRNSVPRRSYTVLASHRFDEHWSLSGTYIRSSDFTWPADGDPVQAFRRTDLRAAYAFRLGATRAELAFTAQSVGDRYQEYRPAYRFGRRSFLTLNLDF